MAVAAPRLLGGKDDGCCAIPGAVPTVDRQARRGVARPASARGRAGLTCYWIVDEQTDTEDVDHHRDEARAMVPLERVRTTGQALELAEIEFHTALRDL